MAVEQICSRIQVAKSSVSVWCRDVELSASQRKELSGRGGKASGRGAANRLQRAQEIHQIRADAQQAIPCLSIKDLKMLGLMLYWAEGAKSGLVDFANSDPDTIALMMIWFRKVCRIQERDFRIQLHLHAGQDELLLKKYWSELTGVPLQQFHRSFTKPKGTGHRKRKLYYGTVKIRICNKNCLHQILGWIEAVRKQVGSLAQLVEQVT